MKVLIPHRNCTGCSACAAVCPQQAIAMAEDREGFLLPRIDETQCNQCGLCIKKCPVGADTHERPVKIPKVYAAWTKDRAILRQSSSGGAFSEIARTVLNTGGVVFGAAYDDKMVVRHKAVERWEGLRALRGSKYVQSDIGTAFHEAKAYLDAGRQVLFSGTPCQIAGLKAAIGETHEKLITCDLVCHGVPSPKVFRMAIESIENRYGSKISNFHFRDKTDGWLHPSVKIVFADKCPLKQCNVDNSFYLGFIKNIFLRPSCYKCSCKQNGPYADITLGDFWHLEKFRPGSTNWLGTSVIIVNTEKGLNILHKCADQLCMEECPFSFIEKNSYLLRSAQQPEGRNSFFQNFETSSFDELARTYFKPRKVHTRYLSIVWRKGKSLVERLS